MFSGVISSPVPSFIFLLSAPLNSALPIKNCLDAAESSYHIPGLAVLPAPRVSLKNSLLVSPSTKNSAFNIFTLEPVICNLSLPLANKLI